MAYREMAAGRSIESILAIKQMQTKRREHFWDGEALGRRGWFWSLLGIATAVVFYLVVSFLLGLIFGGVLFADQWLQEPVDTSGLSDQQLEDMILGLMNGSDGLGGLAFLFGAVAIGFPAIWLAARWVQNWRFGAMISIAGRYRWRLLAKAFAVAILTWIGMGIIDWSLGFMVETTRPTFHGFSAKWLWALVLIAPIVVIQSCAEELFFRGYLPQSLNHMLPGILKSRLLIATLCSAAFAALHWGNPDVQQFPWFAMVEFFVLSMVISWLSVRLGGLETAFALHAVNNCMLLLVFSAQEFAMGDHVLFTLPLDQDFGGHWSHWLIHAGHLVLTFALFWVIGMWRGSPLSLVVEAEAQGLNQPPSPSPSPQPAHDASDTSAQA